MELNVKRKNTEIEKIRRGIMNISKTIKSSEQKFYKVKCFDTFHLMLLKLQL